MKLFVFQYIQLNILKKRRSEKEIIQYLNKLNLTLKEADKMINKLKDINLINDREYCRAYINDKVYLSNFGINKIKNELINQDISLHIIEEELDKIDKTIFYTRLEKILTKKIKSNKKYSSSYLKQKVLNDLLKLGYEKNAIIEMINKYSIEDSSVLEYEFNKLCTKLINKYDGENLNK